jgi:hypothetical protein
VGEKYEPPAEKVSLWEKEKDRASLFPCSRPSYLSSNVALAACYPFKLIVSIMPGAFLNRVVVGLGRHFFNPKCCHKINFTTLSSKNVFYA